MNGRRPHRPPPNPATPASPKDEGPLPSLPLEPVDPRDEWGEDLFVDLEPAAPASGKLFSCCGVTFQSAGRIVQADAADLALARGDRVVVDGEHGVALATVATPTQKQLWDSIPPLRVLRQAETSDLSRETRNQAQAHEALALFRKIARSHNLPIKPVHCDFQQGGRRVLFYFASENRLDFRPLVHDLARELAARIEMRQLGLRDSAKRIGGVGDCGQSLCCSTFLPRFEPVAIRMAKDQNLPLNPSRVSGQCGRLKCCLVYEHAQYSEALRGLPRVGKIIGTPQGEGRVQELDILRRRVRVSFPDGPMVTFEAASLTFPAPTGPLPVTPGGAD